ncbi:MAG TPA: hypothetical protein VHX88_11365 [Solirubrobacteraceae bacterium]|nr:hypothetical protein [Solirubrobacteraceae bacterium]
MIVPAGDAPPDRPVEIAEAEIAEPGVPVDGAVSDSDGEATPTTVSAIEAPACSLDRVGNLAACSKSR